MPDAAADATVHISSAVVSVLPAYRAPIAQALAAMPGIEVHHQSDSKIVIVLEAPDSSAIGGTLAGIATMKGVLSANMVFEQVERLADLGE
jgi:nitrate reductase NapD